MARCTAFLRSERVVVPAKAVAATALYCLIGSLVYAYGQGLSGVEAFYFIVVTKEVAQRLAQRIHSSDVPPDADGLPIGRR